MVDLSPTHSLERNETKVFSFYCKIYFSFPITKFQEKNAKFDLNWLVIKLLNLGEME